MKRAFAILAPIDKLRTLVIWGSVAGVILLLQLAKSLY